MHISNIYLKNESFEIFEGVKRLPVSELLLAQLSYSDCRAGKCGGGWGGNEGAWVTCGGFMEEIDTHVLRTIYGIWVGKIVFLIFRICVNNIIFVILLSGISHLFLHWRQYYWLNSSDPHLQSVPWKPSFL